MNRKIPARFDRPRRFFILSVICLLASCATTKVTETWKDEQSRGPIRKVAVLGVFQEPDTRKIFEDEFADRLRARGIEAVAGHKFIPDAEMPDKDVVIGKIRKLGADTVVLTRVVDTETVQTIVSGRDYLVPQYYSYYGTYYTHIYEPGYIAQEGVTYAETNLYRISDEKLIWSGRSRTELSATRYELIQAFVKIMIDRLAADGLIR